MRIAHHNGVTVAAQRFERIGSDLHADLHAKRSCAGVPELPCDASHSCSTVECCGASEEDGDTEMMIPFLHFCGGDCRCEIESRSYAGIR